MNLETHEFAKWFQVFGHTVKIRIAHHCEERAFDAFTAGMGSRLESGAVICFVKIASRNEMREAGATIGGPSISRLEREFARSHPGQQDSHRAFSPSK